MIKTLTSEDRRSGKLKQHHVELPSPQRTAEAIRQLDGEFHSMVILVSGDNESIAVGGGNDGVCVIDFTDNESEYRTLRHDVADPEEKEIVSGGQLAPFQKPFLVPIETAILLLSDWNGNLPSAPTGFRWVDSSEVQ